MILELPDTCTQNGAKLLQKGTECELCDEKTTSGNSEAAYFGFGAENIGKRAFGVHHFPYQHIEEIVIGITK